MLTLAVGKPLYLRLAVNLARSFVWWHKRSNIRFWIATDQPLKLEPELRNVSVLRLRPDELPKGFSAKLYVDRLAPASHTLFIDADCLCVGPLEFVFDRFYGRAVSVVGSSINDGEWFGDVRALLHRFDLTEIPYFNGGTYYVERGDFAARVYDKARELEALYDGLGLVRLRGRPNEELPMALAMALHGLTGIPDDGAIVGDLNTSRGEMEVSVLRGRSLLVNPPAGDPRHNARNPRGTVRPRIIHFLGDATSSWQYRAEEKKMSLAQRLSWPPRVAESLVNVTFSLPQQQFQAAKAIGRPLYHRLFGPRAVKASERLVL